MLKLLSNCSLEHIILTVLEDFDLGDTFCLYGPSNAMLQPHQLCWLDNYPDVSDDGEEILPEQVLKQGLAYLYSGQHLADVVHNVRQQNNHASMSDYCRALDFYAKNDTFLDF
jgi:hypothetical protein